MKRLLFFGSALAFLLVLLAALPGLANPEFTCADVTEIPQLECEALVALYNSTNGPGWYDNARWLMNNTPSTWSRAFVDSGHVIQLWLSGNNLRGTLPAELGNLSNLYALYLHYNLLSGSIPTEMGNLSSLESLWLGNNQLSGPIPAELGSLSLLDHLFLQNNQLSGSIPMELGNMTNLWGLDLSSNRLTGNIPHEMGNLSRLSFLNLSNNLLSGPIPAELGNMGSFREYVEEVNLSNNQLSGAIPPELGNLNYLHILHLNNNQLSGSIPPELGNMHSLERLYLGNNQLIGAIPTELANLSNLYILHLNNNQLTGDVPENFVMLTTLSDPGQAPDGGDGLDLDFNALNIPAGYPDPDIPLHTFLSQKDPEWHILQGLQQVIGSAGGTLTSLDGRTTFDIPAGALITDTIFTFTPQPVPNYSPARLSDAHNTFLLSAVDAGGTPVITFTLPVTATLSYTDTDIASIFEDTLGLYLWDGIWVDALSSCTEGEYARDLDANSFSLPICHLSEFAVLGETLQIFLPMVLVQR